MTLEQPELPLEVEQLKETLAGLRLGNRAVYDEIIRNGLRPDVSSIVMLRMEVLLETLFGGLETAERIQFEITYEEHMEKALSEMLEQTQRAKLLAPPPAPQRPNGNIVLPPNFKL
jgi:hypothetical protein